MLRELVGAAPGALLRWSDPGRHAGVIWWYERAFGLIAATAFVSLGVQVDALVGEHGILPAANLFEAATEQLGWQRFVQLPSLYWCWPSDAMLFGLCGAGTLAGLAIAAGRLPALASAVVFACYLSLVHAGQIFMGYQWDALLVECALLNVFLTRRPRLGLILYRLLLLRFMLLSGVVKLASGDPAWQHLTALEYHFETQPLPTPPAWYAHHLPDGVLQAGVVATLVIELLLPLLILASRRARAVAAAGFIMLELLILATGSYNFFNLLTIALCVLLLDDAMLGRLARWRQPIGGLVRWPWLWRGSAAALALLGVLQIGAGVARGALPNRALVPLAWASQWRAVNGYGVFAVMTTRRLEIVIEGSADGRTWLPYVLPYQPGPVDRAPVWAAPHQPRLDWQMWFAALGPHERAPWFRGLLVRLLTEPGPVGRLIEVNPFEHAPPRWVRARLYEYRFTTPQQRASSGHWWRRSDLGLWHPPVGFRMRTETTFPDG